MIRPNTSDSVTGGFGESGRVRAWGDGEEPAAGCLQETPLCAPALGSRCGGSGLSNVGTSQWAVPLGA